MIDKLVELCQNYGADGVVFMPPRADGFGAFLTLQVFDDARVGDLARSVFGEHPFDMKVDENEYSTTLKAIGKIGEYRVEIDGPRKPKACYACGRPHKDGVHDEA